MTTDKTPATLATVKHGGRVKLGDWPSIEERARELLAAEYAMAGSTKRADKIIAGFDCAPGTEYALRAIVAALSAQPSPGGQVDSDTLWWLQDAINTMAEGGNESHVPRLQALHNSLAARQPVTPTPQQISDYLRGLDAIKRAVAEREALAARQPVGSIPAGFVLVPEKFGIPAEVWEGVEFVIGGPGTGEGEAYLDSTAWVGDLIQDDGSAVYGLHLSCDECPEEGSVTLSEFTARAEVQP